MPPRGGRKPAIYARIGLSDDAHAVEVHRRRFRRTTISPLSAAVNTTCAAGTGGEA
jgi:hypothetical protein